MGPLNGLPRPARPRTVEGARAERPPPTVSLRIRRRTAGNAAPLTLSGARTSGNGSGESLAGPGQSGMSERHRHRDRAD